MVAEKYSNPNLHVTAPLHVAHLRRQLIESLEAPWPDAARDDLQTSFAENHVVAV